MLIAFNFAKIWKHPNRPPLAAFTCTTVSGPWVKTRLVRTGHKWVLCSQMTDVMTNDCCDGYMTDVRVREGHRQSDEHWNHFKGDIWETYERRGGAHMGFFERLDTNLNCEDRRLIWWQVICSDCIIVWGQMTDMMTSDMQWLYHYVRPDDWYDDNILVTDQLRILSRMSDNTGAYVCCRAGDVFGECVHALNLLPWLGTGNVTLAFVIL